VRRVLLLRKRQGIKAAAAVARYEPNLQGPLPGRSAGKYARVENDKRRPGFVLGQRVKQHHIEQRLMIHDAADVVYEAELADQPLSVMDWKGNPGLCTFAQVSAVP
jgi:hypothetical protein